VAHDFNNMLSVIRWGTEAALEQLAPGDAARADLEEVRVAATRSIDLTRQLLAFARKQTVKPQVLDLNQAVSSMHKMLERLIGEDVDFQWQPGAGLWPVTMDPAQLDQVLANLCVNARDAITGNGRIIIATRNVTIDGREAQRIPGMVPGDYATLSVGDDGSGMDEATLAHLFEPFFTTKALGKGTGLGLATSYGVVTQNHGFIGVQSTPGRGTTFTVYLPRKALAAAPGLPVSRQVVTARASATVLLVEDEPALLRITQRMLADRGYTVIAAGRPTEALALSKQFAGPIQVLVSDVVMPEMNGKQLADQLVAQRPELRCLFISGYTADVIAPHGVLDANTHFLQKPFDASELVGKVQELLDARR
jgi:CheY-like chemotaxis protein